MPHKTYAFVALGIAVFVLITFLIVEALGISLLTDPSDQLDKGGAWAALLGIGLLLVDILVPVPSSLVMTAQGALYGVALGTLFSWIGSTGAGLMGFWVGRRSSRLINRFVSESERTAANRLIDRWGGFALIASRPLPILAETTAITAGTTSSHPRPGKRHLRKKRRTKGPPSWLWVVAVASVLASGAVYWWTQLRGGTLP